MAWLQAGRVPGAVIGGVAASVLGRPRLTRDVDLLVLLDPERWERFLAVGAKFGFSPRLSDALNFARRRQVLLVHHRPSGIDVDISFGALPFEKESIARAIRKRVGRLRLRIVTPEDLIVMKAVAHRARDAADVESVLEANPKLDLRRVRRWVRAFSEAMELPEILEDLEAILARQRSGGRRPRGRRKERASAAGGSNRRR